jgi:hypothetical protein
MTNLIWLVLCAFAFSSNCLSCKKDHMASTSGDNKATNPTKPTPAESKMKIMIGGSTFTATLYKNATAIAFKSLFPLTINMIELNGNEKYFDLPRSLPNSPANPGMIQNGDLMLYGSSTLVLFYKGFSTSYSYTKVGRVDNPSELAAALGSGNVSIIYELE